jgi:hypothetical protein
MAFDIKLELPALTGDAPELEGAVGVTGVRSDVRAAVAFYPPTDFLAMDAWAVRACTPPRCHDDATSPESRLVGCAIQTCAGKAQAANPVRYVTAADPPLLILHGGSDPLVPHNQGEQLYMALNKACHDATFISLPKAGHGPWNAFLTDDAVREAATIRTTSAAGCAVIPVASGLTIDHLTLPFVGVGDLGVAAYPFLFDAPAQFHDWWFDGPVAIGAQQLHPRADALTPLLSHAYASWRSWPPGPPSTRARPRQPPCRSQDAGAAPPWTRWGSGGSAASAPT